MKKVYGVIAAFLAAVAFLSCKVESSGGGGGGTSEPEPEVPKLTGIDFTDTTRQNLNEIKVGGTVELLFQELWSDGSTKDVAYNSSDFDIVISSGTEFVKKDGNSISAIAAGSVKISVTYKNDYSKDISFTVKAIPVDQVVLTSIAIEPLSTIAENASKDLKVTATYSDETTKDVTSQAKFESSDSSIAAIEGTALKGLKEGEVTIKATFEGKTASITVKVYKPVEGKVLSEITIAPAAKELKSGESAEFTVTAKYSNGDSEDVTSVAEFSSDKEDAGALEKNKFTAAKLPEDTSVKITASYEYEGVEKTAAAAITVKKDESYSFGTGNAGFNFGSQSALSKIEITSAKTLTKDSTLTLKTEATYSNGDVAEVFPAYEVENAAVLELDGITLKAISAGTSKVTATYTEGEVTETATATITVTEGSGDTGSGAISVEFGS